jgi:hypothetical protein
MTTNRFTAALSALFLFLFCFISSVSLAQPAGQAPIPDKFKGIITYAPLIDTPANYLTPGSSMLKKRGTLESVSGSVFAQGVYRMTINQKTGTVDEVGVLLRAGRELDAAAIMTFFKWKFKPGAIKQLDAPVIFSRSIVINLSKAASR